jgi:hypothetical protein
MESTGSSDGASERSNYKWSDILGTMVAILTLTLPLISIAYYSSFNNSAEALPNKSYPQPNSIEN